MKATSQLHVPPNLRVTVTLDMTVEEMDSILSATQEVTRWPMGRLRECLQQSLRAARAAYSSEHVTD